MSVCCSAKHGRAQARTSMKARSVHLLAATLQVLIALSILIFLFATYNGPTIWWLQSSPWARKKPSGFMNIPYNALTNRLPKLRQQGPTAPVLLGAWMSFKVIEEAV